MTTEEIREAAKVMEAYANGKKIQYLNDDNEWIDTPKPFFDWHSYVYRIKPGLMYRPFKSQEECWSEMLKHQPFGWIYCKNDSCYYCIISVDEGKIELSPDMYPHSETTPKEYYLEKDYFFFDAALESFEFAFADGTPFGIKKEE